MLNKLGLLILLVPLGVFAREFDCVKSGKIRKMYHGEISVEKTGYCSNEDGTILISYSCHREKCMKDIPFVDFDMTKDMISEIGSPGFALCRKLDGTPEIIEFEWKGEWLSLDRCILSPPSNYIDTGHLYKLNSQKLRNQGQ